MHWQKPATHTPHINCWKHPIVQVKSSAHGIPPPELEDVVVELLDELELLELEVPDELEVPELVVAAPPAPPLPPWPPWPPAPPVSSSTSVGEAQLHAAAPGIASAST
jgi:hypothetical protein